MSRQLTPSSTLENLKREAKRWLKALRAHEPAARARFERALPEAPSAPTLRDVQHALAREHGLPGWTALKRAALARQAAAGDDPRRRAVTELFEAALAGDVARAAAVLDAHPDIVSERAVIPGHEGARTALHHALGHADVVRLLLERGADPNVRDEGDDALPLHFAAERGDLAVIRLLVEHGADTVGDGTVHELNVLGWAVCWDYAHNLEAAEYLLAHGARHTIHTAVALGDTDAIRAIVARAPAELERPMDGTNRRRHPLHLAVVKGRADSLAALLALGADTEAEDAAGMTALDQAALSGATELVRLLIEHGAEVRLPAAVALDRPADVERLLRADPDGLKPGARYGTLLIRAAERASGDTIRALIRAGAAVNAPDDAATAVDGAERYTALHAAAFNGNIEAVRALLEHGADPDVRDSRYCSAPAGWAAYAGRADARDLILAGRIDPFQAIDHDRADRLPAIVRQSPWLLEKPFREIAACPPRDGQWWPEPWHTPLVWAVVRDRADAIRALLEQGASQPLAPDRRTLVQVALDAGRDEAAALLRAHRRVDESHAGRVRWFVKNACPDHDIRGGPAHAIARGTAERLLRRHPEIARDSFWTAVICGDLDAVARALDDRPALAVERGGPKEWTALLYLCFTRLPGVAAAVDNAVAIATLLLDRGADPNVFFMAGDSSYTPLVGVVGEGEEERPRHPRRDALARLLLDRGADPYDTQVLYDVTVHPPARRAADDGERPVSSVLWLLQLIHAHAVERGSTAAWQDPAWRMLDMGGYGTGARYLLEHAIAHDDAALAAWCLERGANPEAAPAADPRRPQHALHEDAVRRGRRDIAQLLVRYGATPSRTGEDAETAFVDACLRLDREAARSLAAAHPEYLRSTRAMFAAVERDRADVVALLLELGVPIEVENEHAQRPLHAAAWSDAVAVARLLIDRGAEVDARERMWHNTPFDFAVHHQHARTIALLAPHSRDIGNLVFTGSVERVREVLREAPALARAAGEWGTPLMWLPDDEEAAVEIVRLFLEHGADVTVRDRGGRTAADHAGRRGLVAAAALLRAAETAPT